MPDPGSKAHDNQKARARRDLEEEGVTDDEAAEAADEAMDEAEAPEGRQQVDARRSSAGQRQGEPWPDRPPPAG
jgi:hypothetical protein